jgi:lysophospholipase
LLTLADGGLDGANIPLQPLLVKARGIRAIIAHDATADKEDNFADGTAMIVRLVIALHTF